MPAHASHSRRLHPRLPLLLRGAPHAQVVTQANLIGLLFGTLCCALALTADVGKLLVDRAAGEQPLPSWLTGRVCMAFVVCTVLVPLCMQRHMRQVRGCHVGIGVPVYVCRACVCHVAASTTI